MATTRAMTDYRRVSLYAVGVKDVSVQRRVDTDGFEVAMKITLPDSEYKDELEVYTFLMKLAAAMRYKILPEDNNEQHE
jgi:hypothetical protein